MILRTPRRRVSPHTKRKFRAFKKFLRRALATSFHPGTITTSSVEVSFSDVKSQVTATEQELDTVSKHYRDLNCFKQNFRKESESSVASPSQRNEQENFNTDVNEAESKLLHKSSNSQHRNSNENQNTVNGNQHNDNGDENMAIAHQSVAQSIQDFQFKQKKELRKKRHEENDVNLRKQRSENSKYNTIGPTYSTSSFHSIESGNNHYFKPRCSSYRHEKKHTRKEFTEPLLLKEHKDREQKDLRIYERATDNRHHKNRTKRVYSEVDKDFIAEIIQKQYRPVKLFGRRDSDFSQFSAPVCRDQEFTVRNEIQEGVELCSCCLNECRKKRHRNVRNTDLSDMRSICDTRLYSCKKHGRYKELERDVEDYNNAVLYDVVPVKEKSSPKSRRKFAEDNMIAFHCSKEVPPSPRSHRPRLNLKVQHADYEDCLNNGRYQSQRNSPIREFRKNATNVMGSDTSSVSYPQRTQLEILNRGKKPQRPVQILEDVGTMSSLQYPNFTNEQVNIPYNDTTLNTQLADSTADKTDKTLDEIKEILRSFLLEMKKESAGACDGFDDTCKTENKQLPPNQRTKINSNMITNQSSFNNYDQYSIAPFPTNQCMPAVPSPCCFPVLPICPMNCMQNGYIVPSPSYTCNVCARTCKEHGCSDKNCSNNIKPAQEGNTNNETQDLIKEIHKLISQKSKSPRNTDEMISARAKNERLVDTKVLTSRYVGGSSKASKHDANVGTPELKYYSKSCEAIGSRTLSEAQNTNVSYSDTVLEKLNLEATQSSSETEISTDIPEEKVKQGNSRKKFNPWRLFRKKKKDVIKEMSESNSTEDEKVNPKPPFKQHIQSYMMHGQEYHHQPPNPGPYCCVSPRNDCCRHRHETRNKYQIPSHDFYNHSHYHDYPPPQHYNPNYRTAPPNLNYDYHNHPPQVPLCLKEIEVKSVGIQSEKKMSILKKLMQKKPVQQQQQEEATNENVPIEKNNFWKSLQEKAKQTDNNDTKNFSFKMQKQLAQGDMNMKNAMMKKLFYKRNPFSPRNLIVRTLLGKDKSSYGNPPKIYKPRMFL